MKDEDLIEKARTFATAKERELRSIDLRKEIGKELLTQMNERRRVRVEVEREDDIAKVGKKTRETLTIDEDRLKKELGARAYNRLTTPQLDEVKLEAAIRSGQVDPNVVAACSTESSTEYLEVRFTKKRG